MATHHESRKVEYIARDLDQLAAHLQRDADRLRNFAELLRTSVNNDGEALDSVTKHNIKENTRRAAFEPMRSAGYATSVESLMHTLDRFVSEEG